MADLTTRFPNGVTNSTEDGAFGKLCIPRETTYASYFNDFFEYIATEWVVTETAAGSTETIVAAGEGGQFALTNVSAGATDEVSLQWSSDGGTTAATQWTWDVSKDMFIHARFKLSNATLAACLIGLAIADTTPVASLPANGIFFYKAGGAATLIASARKAGTSTSVTLGSVVADTFVDAVFFYDATTGRWAGYLNDAYGGSFDTASVSPTVALTPTIGLLNASAAAHVLTVDRIWIGKKR